jgi:hypothetical protein
MVQVRGDRGPGELPLSPAGWKMASSPLSHLVPTIFRPPHGRSVPVLAWQAVSLNVVPEVGVKTLGGQFGWTTRDRRRPGALIRSRKHFDRGLKPWVLRAFPGKCNSFNGHAEDW